MEHDREQIVLDRKKARQWYARQTEDGLDLYGRDLLACGARAYAKQDTASSVTCQLALLALDYIRDDGLSHISQPKRAEFVCPWCGVQGRLGWIRGHMLRCERNPQVDTARDLVALVNHLWFEDEDDGDDITATMDDNMRAVLEACVDDGEDVDLCDEDEDGAEVEAEGATG